MTDIEPVEPEMTALMVWAQDARQVASIAESIAKTSFVPKAFAGKPAEVTAAILAGAEVGLQPLASLRSINVIQGQPALSALAMRGVVQAHGHEIWVEESSENKAVVCGRRAGLGKQTQRSEWTIDRARRLGLLGKDNWVKQPQAMLIARATAECCRLTAADALAGLAYAVEEIADQADEKPVRKRTAQRKPIPEPELETPVIEAEVSALPAGDGDE